MKTWFKFYGPEFLSDPKMDFLTANEISIWVTMMCLASMVEEEGVIRYMTEDKIMTKARLNDNEKLSNRNYLQKFKKLKLISIDNENDEIVITLLNFTKRNKALTPYERVKNYRERQKLSDDNEMITYDNDRKKEEKEEKERINDGKTKKQPSSRINNPDEDKQDFETKRKEALKRLSPLEAELDNPTDKAWAEKSGLVQKAGISLIGLVAFLFVSFAPVQAFTMKASAGFYINRPVTKFSGTSSLHKPRTKKPENKKTPAVERPMVARTVIEKKILEKFGEDGRVALAIARAESGVRENAIGDGHLTFTHEGVEYGKSYGPFQIRSLPGRPAPELLLQADYNINYAYELYKRSGFSPWSAYTNKSYMKFL